MQESAFTAHKFAYTLHLVPEVFAPQMISVGVDLQSVGAGQLLAQTAILLVAVILEHSLALTLVHS